jgi:predicted metal-dependent enzyme (double-stranded beta helix superfamily)
MFDLDQFLADCRSAVRGDEPLLAIREVLVRAVEDPRAVAATLPITRAELVPLCVEEDITVLKAVWAPHMRIRAHNHLMWAAIALYHGEEDNTFYRRDGDGITVSGGRVIETGDAALLGDDTIHAVSNPGDSFSAGIHVYGGDLMHRPDRSEWDETDGEVRTDFDRTLRYFAEANAALERTTR